MLRFPFPVARARRSLRLCFWPLAVAAAMLPTTGSAVIYDSEWLGGFSATLNTELQIAGQWRIQDRSKDQIGKANLNPNVCRSACQPHLSTPAGTITGRVQLGLDAEGDRVNQVGLDAPGAGTINLDDGNLNYNKYDITQGVAQLRQDLTLDFGDVFFLRNFQIFGRVAAFHDFVNFNRPQFYPNFYTPQDRIEDDMRITDLDSNDGNVANNFCAPTVGNPAFPPGTPLCTSPGGQFGEPQPGTALFRRRSNQYNELVGQDIDLLDAFVQFDVPVPFTDFYGQLTIGEQIINWGESTILVVNSLNTINPPNVNALFRPAFLSLAAVFEPIGAIKYAMPLTANTSFEAFYQYDWEKVEIPPSGAFLSTIDVTLDEDINFINPGFGQVADDPDGNLNAQQQLLSGIADTQGNVPIFEQNASNNGQFGFAYTWFLPDFNNGTELRFYYAKYNSRLPYFSAFATQESCLQQAPDGLFGDNQNGSNPGALALSQDCGGQNTAQVAGAIVQELLGEGFSESTYLAALNTEDADDDGLNDPEETSGNGFVCPPNSFAPGSGPCAEGYVLDQFEGLLEYPEGINLYGMSFNTSFGDVSFQGEVVYRPNLPLQIDDIDVAFTALQPGAPLGCSGANANANCVPGSTDDVYAVAATLTPTALSIPGAPPIPIGAFLDASGGVTSGLQTLLNQAGVDALDNLPVGGTQVYLSDAPGRAVAFPSFLDRYRGIAPGTRQGSLPDLPGTAADEGRRGDYIQGYERFQVIQYNVGATYVIGPGNWLRSDQIILLFEVGANQVLGFPELDELQIDGPGTNYSASVGSDGTGAPVCGADDPATSQEENIQGEAANPNGVRARRANTTICGQFQPRFNSTQQQGGFATAFSWGYRIIGLIRHENVLPGISFETTAIFGHDVSGTSPGPGENFLEDRQVYIVNVDMRYQQNWSLVAGFTVFRGGRGFNLLTDRDFVQLGLRYRF